MSCGIGGGWQLCAAGLNPIHYSVLHFHVVFRMNFLQFLRVDFNTIENLLYAVAGAALMLLFVVILRKIARFVSDHWRIIVGVSAIAAAVGVFVR